MRAFTPVLLGRPCEARLTNPRIPIFDKATSALDAESEEIVQRNMRMTSHGQTEIVIAHRLSAVRQADRIVTVEKGRIAEAITRRS